MLGDRNVTLFGRGIIIINADNSIVNIDKCEESNKISFENIKTLIIY